MERIGAWLWGRKRARFIGWAAAVGAVFSMVSIMVPSVVVGSVFLDLRRAEALLWGASVATVIALMTPVMLASMRRETAAIARWSAGDRTDPLGAWDALVRLPSILSVRIVGVVVPIIAVVTLPLVLAMADTDGLGVLGLLMAYVLVSGVASLLFSTAVHMVLRPAISEVGDHLGAVTSIERGSWGIRGRLVLIVFAAASLAGVVLPCMVLGGAASTGDYLLAMAGGAVWAAYFAWIFDLGLLKPTLSPLRDVMEATVRVRRGDVSTPVPVSSIDELGDLAAAFNEMQRGLAERAALHAAFGSYVDPALAQRLIESGSSVFEGEELVVTVLFADVRGFTSYAEGVAPSEALERLNRLFDVMVPVLHEHGGHSNHYLGDGLLAVFGAPNPLERHADAAVAAAVEIQERVRAEFGGDLSLGIGVNTGPVIAGTVGGGGRLEFTVIGDTVNAAARVEQLTKDTGDAILITDATRRALTPPRTRTRRRGEFEVRGRAHRLVLHAVDPPARARSGAGRTALPEAPGPVGEVGNLVADVHHDEPAT